MTTGWEVYYLVFLTGIISLVLPLALGVFSFILTFKGKTKSGKAKVERPVKIYRDEKINTRFFLMINVASVLIALSLILIPISGVFQVGFADGSEDKRLWVLAVVSVAGFLALGLFYAARKGDLGWIRDHKSNKRFGGADGRRW